MSNSCIHDKKEADEFKYIYKDVRTAINNPNPDDGLKKRHISNMVNTILRRKRFEITNKEIFTNWLIRACCKRSFKCVNKRTYKRHRLIEKAEHAVVRKLDVLDILKSTQLNQILLSAVLTPEQRLLLLY